MGTNPDCALFIFIIFLIQHIHIQEIDTIHFFVVQQKSLPIIGKPSLNISNSTHTFPTPHQSPISSSPPHPHFSPKNQSLPK